ncbi:hypothetical protein EG359_01890 [Chryseobacterium joostei]|uniref:Uncharacterized protein n=2 Tax=Chryseobacterium TaxID=59732 RepID=A0A1N7INX8_9FLAO|nr:MULTISPECIES: hypothetical protein [Chryseobacterium]AZA98430.1 hypothetical protein EG359_01890 [Chryseobacterium joostei]PWN65962.1 hypothetical protein C1638_006145 [Chryseobacterium oncorhynchi]SIS38774.1 hypothetical protein SAMN05421768_106150 [Chryseobacterium joostei]HCM35847.1 hypothetical protein [Chryseobacterium sp.]
MKDIREGFNHHKVILKIKQKIENHYSDKFTYAMPDWAMMSAAPDIISILTIHSEEGVQIAKQKVNFPVDFYNISSVVDYVDFLSHQMNTQKEIIGYVVFYNKNTLIIKDPNYLQDLTAFQENELNKYNQAQSQVDISLMLTDQNWDEVNVLDDLLS